MSHAPPNPALARANAAHTAAFGAPPASAALAPGRVNLIGEHTDYNEGLVLPFAIQHCCAAAVSPRTDSQVHILAPDLPAEQQAFAFDLHSHDRTSMRGDWASYIAGPAVLLAAIGNQKTGVNITIASDVPLGAGLSSSAAAEVSVAMALAGLWRLDLAPLDLAKLCQRAEHDFAGVPCGLMDQLASVFGQEGRGMLIDCRENAVNHIALPPSDRAVMVVINSGVRHSLAAGEYAARRAACQAAAGTMGVSSLRDATGSMIATAGLPSEQHDCAMHVVSENERVRDFAASVAEGSLAAAGCLMFASHESLRDLYRVSCAELDTLVEIARSVRGVFGSRMTGGGFGGCTVTLCDPEAAARLSREVPAAYRAAHQRECRVFPVTASVGARLTKLPG